jgi:hypothetical protein
MCTVMPLGDVQAKSPFQGSLAMTTQDPTGGCEYAAAIGSSDPVEIVLIITDPRSSPAAALTALANYRQEVADRGLPVQDIPGLGDAAIGFGSDEVGVHAVVGAREIDANLKGEWPDTPDSAKIAAGTTLVTEMIARLP